MARYTEAVCKLCRREGQKLFLKGERCYTDKCAINRRAYAPGQHGQGRKKTSEYGLQLRAKQMTRRFYGVLENQFHHYYEMATTMQGKAGDNLLITGPTTGVMYVTPRVIHGDDGPVTTAGKGTRVSIEVPGKVRPSDKLFKLIKTNR